MRKFQHFFDGMNRYQDIQHLSEAVPLKKGVLNCLIWVGVNHYVTRFPLFFATQRFSYPQIMTHQHSEIFLLSFYLLFV